MSNSDDDSRYLKERLHINQVITAVVAAALVGFVVAAYLGAFSTISLKEVPAWVSALTAVVAAVISAYAVYLVAQTLKATRETLDATREMNQKQSELVHTQIRPWIVLSEFQLSPDPDAFRLKFRVKNYGLTPAKVAKISIVGQLFDKSFKSGISHPKHKCLHREIVHAYIPPNDTAIDELVNLGCCVGSSEYLIVDIVVEYQSLLSLEKYDMPITVLVENGLNGLYFHVQ